MPDVAVPMGRAAMVARAQAFIERHSFEGKSGLRKGLVMMDVTPGLADAFVGAVLGEPRYDVTATVDVTSTDCHWAAVDEHHNPDRCRTCRAIARRASACAEKPNYVAPGTEFPTLPHGEA